MTPYVRISIVERNADDSVWITLVPIRATSLAEVWKSIDEAAEAMKMVTARTADDLLARLS